MELNDLYNEINWENPSIVLEMFGNKIVPNSLYDSIKHEIQNLSEETQKIVLYKYYLHTNDYRIACDVNIPSFKLINKMAQNAILKIRNNLKQKNLI
jgi:DNA-directed RNA polymerase specialized sigma24 family protein